MCGRFTSLFSPELIIAIRELFGVPVPDPVEPRYNVAPSQQVWVVRQEGDHNRFDLMKWGLIPSWAKDPKIGSKMINARSETVHEKPAFRQAIKFRRCIIPADGFYEWMRSGDKKQPYYIRMANGTPMLLAGLWDHWKGPGEENSLGTFTILTTAANDLVMPLHDRMPVILHPGDCSLWLSHSMHNPDQLGSLYQPFPSKLLEAHKVSDLVNNPHFDSPACITKV